MIPRSVALRGLTLAEAEAFCALIDETQEEAYYEITMTEMSESTLLAITGITIPDYAIRVGADPDDIAADLARQRVELRTWRDEALARLRGFLERGCATLN
jgi:hypothetical protein